MAPLAIISGSTIGAIVGFLAWLFTGIGVGTAFGIYLGCGLGLPLVAIAAAALRSAATPDAARGSHEESKALVA